jgi:hypothetical protein
MGAALLSVCDSQNNTATVIDIGIDIDTLDHVYP